MASYSKDSINYVSINMENIDIIITEDKKELYRKFLYESESHPYMYGFYRCDVCRHPTTFIDFESDIIDIGYRAKHSYDHYISGSNYDKIIDHTEADILKIPIYWREYIVIDIIAKGIDIDDAVKLMIKYGLYRHYPCTDIIPYEYIKIDDDSKIVLFSYLQNNITYLDEIYINYISKFLMDCFNAHEIYDCNDLMKIVVEISTLDFSQKEMYIEQYYAKFVNEFTELSKDIPASSINALLWQTMAIYNIIYDSTDSYRTPIYLVNNTREPLGIPDIRSLFDRNVELYNNISTDFELNKKLFTNLLDFHVNPKFASLFQ
jgi:hypothetical protein